MSPRRRLLLLGVAGVLAIALVVLLGFRLVAAGGGGARPDQARPGTVLLVPGYGGDRAALSRLAAPLDAEGRTTEVLTPYTPAAVRPRRGVEAPRGRGLANVPVPQVTGYGAADRRPATYAPGPWNARACCSAPWPSSP